MSFGKRGAGEGHPARNMVPPPSIEANAGAGVRMKVANPGGIDKGFIALALGVVALSAGAALAAPSVLDMFGGAIPVRPLNVVVAGLDRNQASAALAREAFPDGEGRAFMTSLANSFPSDHANLLGQLADEAMQPGADRNDLVDAMGKWTVQFAPQHIDAIGRTGAEGFDQLMNIATDAMSVVEGAAGGCTLASFESFASNPEALADLAAYGGEGYKVSMRAGRTLVDLAARGAHAQAVESELTQDDVSALQTTFLSLMMDKQVMGLVASATQGGGPVGFGADAVDPSAVDVCQLGRTIIVKLKKLPNPTKARILALGTSGLDPSMMLALQQAGQRQKQMRDQPSGRLSGQFGAGSRQSNSGFQKPELSLQFKGPGFSY